MYRTLVGIAIVSVAVVAVVGVHASPGPIFAGAVLALLVLLVWPRTQVDEDGGESRSVWKLIPRDQYGGRYAESGGLTRDEQEAALREIKRRADEIDDHGHGR